MGSPEDLGFLENRLGIQWNKLAFIRLGTGLQLSVQPVSFPFLLTLVIPPHQIADVFAG